MITQLLRERDKSLVLHNEGEWNGTQSEFEAFNDAGIECEVGEFFYSLLRLLKPDHVLETGTHIGVGASYMGMALSQNQKGTLDTYEFLPELHKQAVARIQKIGLEHIVNCYLQDVATVKPSEEYDFILLDTEPQTRFKEFLQFFDSVKEGGYIFIHDLHRGMCQGNINPDWPNIKSWPFGDIPDKMKQWVKQDKIRLMHFPTPRGLTGFYKVHQGDYQLGKDI